MTRPLRLIPAYAGSTRHGDDDGRTPHGSAPLTRGARYRQDDSRYRARLIPAYAGSTPVLRATSSAITAHPRLRGEHASTSWARSSIWGSSPLTRGAPCHAGRLALSGGLIPAYAGSTCHPLGAQPPCTAHPRLRGEHACRACRAGGALGSSPLTRGARPLRTAGAASSGLIPAYAGSTSSSGSQSPCGTAHPRLRGEHDRGRRQAPQDSGSSPLTRGALPHDLDYR